MSLCGSTASKEGKADGSTMAGSIRAVLLWSGNVMEDESEKEKTRGIWVHISPLLYVSADGSAGLIH